MLALCSVHAVAMLIEWIETIPKKSDKQQPLSDVTEENIHHTFLEVWIGSFIRPSSENVGVPAEPV